MAVLSSYSAACHYHLPLSYSDIMTGQNVFFREIMAIGFMGKETEIYWLAGKVNSSYP